MNKVVIVGGGIIGLFTAWYLQKKGLKVTIVDRGDITDGCSFGNAGLIVPSHVIPLASPGMFKKGIKNMLRPASPVAFHISPDKALLRWYLRFAGASTEKHVKESVPVLKELSWFSKQLYNEIYQSGEIDFQLWNKGLLMLYKSQHTGDELLEEAVIARAAGLEVNELSKADVHQLEPDTLPDITGGFHYVSDDHLNPFGLMNALVAQLENSGVEIIRNCTVENIVTSGNKAVSIATSNGTIEFDQIIITAGFWSTKVLKDLKIKIDVQPGKGYSFKVKHKKQIHYPALLSDANVAVTPINSELTQFGGGMEIGYTGYKISRARVQQIIKSVGQFYPSEDGIEFPELNIWQGHRPCSFDGLPYIGRANGFSNILIGTGHSMMGVTLAPATGKLLSELISGENTTVDLNPFRIGR